jgi:pre-mRNA-processing factor SLU7
LVKDTEEETEEAEDAEKDKEEEKPRKRTREEMMNGVTEEEMDEYRKKRTVTNDPMAKMLGRDELLT